MKSDALNERISAELSGILMVLATSQLLIRGASLTGSSSLPWFWALAYAGTMLTPLGRLTEQTLRRRQMAGSAAVLAALAGLLGVLLGPGSSVGAEGGQVGILGGLLQLTEYLSGASPALAAPLHRMGRHLISAACFLLFLWVRTFGRRSALMGIFLGYGCFRWSQFVPDMEGALLALAAVWCFAAAMGPGAGTALPLQWGEFRRRSGVSLLLALTALALSWALTGLFPLEALNRWAGSRLPPQEWYRNEYAKYSGTDFLLENTQWYPLGNRLGGPVTLTKTPVMEVKSSRPGLHLRGMVKTIYTGQAWEAGALTYRPWKAPPTVTGSKPFVLTLHPFNPRERTLYAPLNTDRIVAENRRILAGGEGLYRFALKWFPGKENVYRVEGFSEIHQAPPLPPEHPYLQLPEISPALRALTEEVAGSRGTDAQKMERLVNWLRAKGTYRLDVAAPDPDREFVEQFVLGTREGYCTYFATALAVMGRAAGVPTRYVEGYILPEQTSGRQTYLITGDRAHAWVEAYITGKGWTVYEPTPVYGIGNGAVAAAPEADDAAGSEPEGSPAKAPEAPTAEGAKIKGILLVGAGWAVGLLFLLSALRVLWVEWAWKRGIASPRRALWELYGILSTLMVMAPELKSYPLPEAQLRAAQAILPPKVLSSRDIIGDANRLLYGNASGSFEGFTELLPELWKLFRHRHGTGAYLVSRYITLSLFNSYTPLIRYPQFRKEVSHGADQPHTPAQS